MSQPRRHQTKVAKALAHRRHCSMIAAIGQLPWAKPGVPQQNSLPGDADYPQQVVDELLDNIIR